MQLSSAKQGRPGLLPSRPRTPDSNATIPSQTWSSWAYTNTPTYTRHQFKYTQLDRVFLSFYHHTHVHQSAMQIYPARPGPPALTQSRPHTPDSNANILSKTGSSGLPPSRPSTLDNNANIPSQTGSSWAYTIKPTYSTQQCKYP